MTLSPRTVSIVIALLLSGSFIALGYYFSSPLSPRFADAQSTEELLKAYAEKDTDSDGLPDWQESLYGTDPENAHSTGPGVTDAEAVANGTVKPRFASETNPDSEPLTAEDFGGMPAPKADSITDRFSKAFLEEYLSGSETLDAAGQQALVTELLGKFSPEGRELVESDYVATSVRVVPGTTVATYVQGIEQILYQYEVPDDWEMAALASALVESGDENARQKLVRFSSLISQSVQALSQKPVPPAVAAQHLALLQAADTVSKIADTLSRYEEDPVGALGALGKYKEAAETIQQTLAALAPAILAEGTPAPGSFAAQIVDFSRALPAKKP